MAYCDWDTSSELNTRYHDEEWGVPLHGDRGQFEFLMMEVMQCGLNWNMMIQKREIFRRTSWKKPVDIYIRTAANTCCLRRTKKFRHQHGAH